MTWLEQWLDYHKTATAERAFAFRKPFRCPCCNVLIVDEHTYRRDNTFLDGIAETQELNKTLRNALLDEIHDLEIELEEANANTHPLRRRL